MVRFGIHDPALGSYLVEWRPNKNLAVAIQGDMRTAQLSLFKDVVDAVIMSAEPRTPSKLRDAINAVIPGSFAYWQGRDGRSWDSLIDDAMKWQRHLRISCADIECRAGDIVLAAIAECRLGRPSAGYHSAVPNVPDRRILGMCEICWRPASTDYGLSGRYCSIHSSGTNAFSSADYQRMRRIATRNKAGYLADVLEKVEIAREIITAKVEEMCLHRLALPADGPQLAEVIAALPNLDAYVKGAAGDTSRLSSILAILEWVQVEKNPRARRIYRLVLQRAEAWLALMPRRGGKRPGSGRKSKVRSPTVAQNEKRT